MCYRNYVYKECIDSVSAQGVCQSGDTEEALGVLKILDCYDCVSVCKSVGTELLYPSFYTMCPEL